MKRREFITLIGGVAAWPHVLAAEQARRVWRIGFLSGSSPDASFNIVAGFTQGMRELGYVEGRDFSIEWRFAEGSYGRFPDLVADLVRLNVDAIVLGTQAAVAAAQRATSTIPIVMGYSVDPVGSGFVSSLARPGGNITGLASSLEDITAKHLEFLAKAVPNLSRVGVLINPSNTVGSSVLSSAQVAAKTAGLVLVPAEARDLQQVASAFAALSNEPVGALVVQSDALFFLQRQRIAELATSHRLPMICPQREYVEAGGLMSYGDSLKDFFRRAAAYVDQIFKGAKPRDLPIQQPTRFYLVINLKTAKALGLEFPPTLLALADEVIE